VITAKSFALQCLAGQSATEVLSPEREYVPPSQGFARAQVA
jgi:hypothetical protein